MKNRMADIHRKAQQRKRDAETRSSGGGGNFPRPQIQDVKFYAPDGSLYEKKEDRGTAHYAILHDVFDGGDEPLLGSVHTHRIRRAVDSGVIKNPKFRANPHYSQYRCTFDPNAGPKDLERFQPMSGWSVDDEGHASLTVRGLSIDILLDDQVLRIPVPEWWAQADDPEECSSLFEDYETAQFAAERILQQGLSCVLCLTAKTEHEKYANEDWQERSKKVDVRFARESFLLPLVSLDWLVPGRGKPNKPSPMVAPDVPSSILMPSNLEIAVRRGLTWLEVSASPQSANFLTWSQYVEYFSSLWSTCSHCLEDGKRTGARHHALSVTSIRCSHCHEPWETVQEADDGSTEAILWDEEACGSLFPDPARHFDVYLGACGTACPHCGEVNDRPLVTRECSTPGCEHPTPTRADEVITRLVMQNASGSQGGYWTFETWMPTSGPHKGRVVWGKEALHELPAVWPPDATVKDYPVTVGDMFATPPPRHEAEEYIHLTPHEQARLIGSTVVDFSGGVSR